MKNVLPTWEELSILRVALFDNVDDPDQLNNVKTEFENSGRIIAIDIKNELHVMNEII